MTFDPAKAYHNDWQYREFIENTSWIRSKPGGESIVDGLKARWGSFDTQDLQNLAGGIAISSEAAAVVLWEPKPDDVSLDDWEPRFAPQQGDVLRRDDKGGERWLVLSFKQSRFGFWNLACEKAPVNVTA